MNANELEAALLDLLNSFESPIPAHQIKDMKELCCAGEAGIALENFATQLVEYDVHVPSSFVDRLEKIGNAMNLDQKYWTWLREVARDGNTTTA
jgi:hypothetical protein